MLQDVRVTPELTREYAQQNMWGISEVFCRQIGPHGGFCTLRRGHGGLHVAHNNATHTQYYDATLYTAWLDIPEDMAMDVGL